MLDTLSLGLHKNDFFYKYLNRFYLLLVSIDSDYCARVSRQKWCKGAGLALKVLRFYRLIRVEWKLGKFLSTSEGVLAVMHKANIYTVQWILACFYWDHLIIANFHSFFELKFCAILSIFMIDYHIHGKRMPAFHNMPHGVLIKSGVLFAQIR